MEVRLNNGVIFWRPGVNPIELAYVFQNFTIVS